MCVIHSRQVAPNGSTAVSPAARNATITSLIVCCGYIACWSPNEIYFFLNFFGYPVDFSGWFYHFTRVSVTILWGSRFYQVRTFYSVNQLGGNISVWSSSGSTTSPWHWCSSTAASTLSSTPPSTASSRTASDVWWRRWSWVSSTSLKLHPPSNNRGSRLQMFLILWYCFCTHLHEAHIWHTTMHLHYCCRICMTA